MSSLVLLNGGNLFRGEVRHANFEGIASLAKSIFLPPGPVFISSLRKCSEQTLVCLVIEKFGPTPLRIFSSHCLRKVSSVGKLKIPLCFLKDLHFPFDCKEDTTINVTT